MNSRERLRRCYAHEELDRPAVYSRTGFPGNDPSYDGLKALLAERADQKLAWRAGFLEAPPPAETRVEPYSADFERQVTVLHTPAGDLQGTELVSLKGQPGLAETCLLKSRADAEKYLSLPAPEIAGDVSGFFAAERQIGERGITDVKLGLNPAGFAAELFGSEEFAVMSVTERAALHALCARRMEALLRRAKFLLAAGVGPYFSMEGEEFLVPPLHGPEDFRDFNLRYDRPILDLVHEAGGRMHIHCHGSVKKVLPMFAEMGVDVLHPLEAPPMGDVTPAEARALTGGRVCLEGNLQIADMYERSPEQVRAQTEALLAAAFADRRNLIVSPTASPYIRGAGEQCLPRYQAMIDAALAWRP
jgi:hypothetical protein